jgi:hypothetical protein
MRARHVKPILIAPRSERGVAGFESAVIGGEDEGTVGGGTLALVDGGRVAQLEVPAFEMTTR